MAGVVVDHQRPGEFCTPSVDVDVTELDSA